MCVLGYTHTFTIMITGGYLFFKEHFHVLQECLIGAGGLGELIFEGLTNFNIPKVLTGAIPAIMIAVLLDISFSLIEKRISLKY